MQPPDVGCHGDLGLLKSWPYGLADCVAKGSPSTGAVVAGTETVTSRLRKAMTLRIPPSMSDRAPVRTCRVAMSAALLDQIVHAPSRIWMPIKPSQAIVRRLAG